ncbi:MAG: Exoribonuclease II, partial [uncultured Ramlibacter sp.]
VRIVRRGRQVPGWAGAFRIGSVGAGRTRNRQAGEGQGGQHPAQVRQAPAFATHPGRASPRARHRTRPRLGVRAGGGVRLRGPGARLLQRQGEPGTAGRGAVPAVRGAALLPPGRQGPVPQGAGRDRAAGTGRDREEAAAAATDRRLGGRAGCRQLPAADPRPALPHPVPAGQERSRVQGGGRGLAGDPHRAVGPAAKSRRHRLALPVPLEALPVRPFPQGHRFPAAGGSRHHRRPAGGAGAGLLDRRLQHHRDRRCTLGAGAGHRDRHGRHPHRRAGAGAAAGHADRPGRAPAAVHRLHAGPQDHDAARGGGAGLHAAGGARMPCSVAVRHLRRIHPGGAGHPHAAGEGANCRQPAPRPTRRPRHRVLAGRRDQPFQRCWPCRSPARAALVPVAVGPALEVAARAGARQARDLQPARLQLPPRWPRRRRTRRHRTGGDHGAAPRGSTGPDRGRGHDPGKQQLGPVAGRPWRPRHLPKPGQPGTGRQGQDGHQGRAARRDRRQVLRLEHLAAAPLHRPGEPVADHRGRAPRPPRGGGGRRPP